MKIKILAIIALLFPFVSFAGYTTSQNSNQPYTTYEGHWWDGVYHVLENGVYTQEIHFITVETSSSATVEYSTCEANKLAVEETTNKLQLELARLQNQYMLSCVDVDMYANALERLADKLRKTKRKQKRYKTNVYKRNKQFQIVVPKGTTKTEIQYIYMQLPEVLPETGAFITK